MKVTFKDDYVLFSNKNGSYHLSTKQFKSMGRENSILFAEREINKKNHSIYIKKTINFNDARAIGLCEYGIKDFCDELNLDISKTYKLSYLVNKLTVRIINKYLDECLKLFDKDIFKSFGGAIGYLECTGSRMPVVFKSGIFSDRILYLMACDFAYSTLHIFEKELPNDKRPRLAIEARLDWLEGKITDKELEDAAHSAKHSASYSADNYASYSPSSSAAYSAFYSADNYVLSAAISTAAAASYSEDAVRTAEFYKKQKNYVIFMLCLEGLK